MARIKLQDARTFWRIMRSISLKEIETEAHRTFALALVGDEKKRREVLQRLYPDRATDAAYPLVRSFDSVAAEDGFPQESGSFDIILDAGGGWAPTDGRISTFSLVELGGWEATVERILDEHSELALALARRFPGFRQAVAQRIIRETSVANAEFAMLNALPGLVPLLGILLPTAMVGDMLLLAKNQALMLYRLAACHGMDLDLRARARDIMPLLGNAFGWRALAREIVGAVPGGVGLAARGAIAYAGTMALGEAMRRFYSLGEQPTRASLAHLYRESLEEARQAASALGRRVRAAKPPRGLLSGRRKRGTDDEK